MAVDSNAIANQAIQYLGDNQPPITGQAPLFDSSPAGVACAKFYTAVVQTIGREFGWDFSRNTFPLVLSGNPATDPFLYEYFYPSNAIQIWQLKAAALTDQNNPLPINWQVANTLVNNVQTKVIQTNLQNAVAVMNNMPSESVWDSGFREAVVRFLASVMSIALAGKPDAAQAYLDSAGQFEQVAEARGN
jgi:hypothetical protein